METVRAELAAVQQESVGLQEELSKRDTERNELVEQQEQLTVELETITSALATTKSAYEATESHNLGAARSEVASVQQQLESLTAEHEVLREQLDSVTVTRNELKLEYDALAENHSKVTQELADLRETLSTSENSLRRYEEDLRSLQQDRDELSQQVDDERSSREKIEGQVRQVEQLVDQRDLAIERAGKLEEELATVRENLELQLSEGSNAVEAVNSQVAELRTQNESLQTSLTSMQREHETVSAMLADERSRLSRIEADNHRLSMIVSEATQREDAANLEWKQRAESQAEEVGVLRSELEDTAAMLSRERHQREHLQTVLHDRKVSEESASRDQDRMKATVEELAKKNSVLEVHSEELHSLQGEHASVKRMLTAMTDQLHAVRQSSDSTEQERQKLVSQIDALNERNAEYDRQLSELAAEKESVARALDGLRETQASEQASHRDLSNQLEKINEENRLLLQQVDANQELKTAYREQKDRLDKVIAQRDEAIASSADVQELVEELREQVQSQSRHLSSLHQQNDQMRQAGSELDKLRRDHLSLQTQFRESADRLRMLTQENDQERNSKRELLDRIAYLEERAKTNEETIRNLRRERAAVVTRSRGQFAASIPIRNRSVFEEESGGRMRRDEVLGMVYTQPPKQKDDLKRISGIAQVLEKKLNAFGVYTYRQIMEWDTVAIAEFSKLLSFRDRIDRDDWIGQARSLYYEKYGRAA